MIKQNLTHMIIPYERLISYEMTTRVRSSMYIRWGFPLFRMTTNNLICPMIVAIIQVLPFPNNPKDLDPSYKMDLDFLDLFWKEITLHHITEEIQYMIC